MNWKGVLWLAISIAVVWSAVGSIRESAERAQWFPLTADEAIHAEGIEVLAQTGRYANWNGSIFPPRLTGGPTLIIPAALLSRWTGWSGSASGRIITYLYFLASILAILRHWGWDRRSDAGFILGMIALGTFFIHWRSLQDTGYYPFAILGESPAIYFTLSSLIAWQRSRPYSSGLRASLAVLSKPYLLLLPICLFLYTFLSGRKGIRTFLGIAAPFALLIWAMSRHAGWDTAWTFIKNYPQMMRSINGAGIPSDVHFTVGLILDQLFLKATHLPEILKWRGILLAGFGTLLGIGIYLQGNRKWAPFVLFAFAQLAWWWGLSPGVQARYLMPAFLILALINVDWLTRRLSNWITPPPRALNWIAFLALSIVAGSQVRASWKEHAGNFENCGFCRQTAIQDYWKSQPSPRPNLYAFSNAGYLHDLDLVLTAPSTIRPIHDPQHFPRDPMNWVSVGEFAVENAPAVLRKHKCRPVFTVGTQERGFWTCQK